LVLRRSQTTNWRLILTNENAAVVVVLLSLKKEDSRDFDSLAVEQRIPPLYQTFGRFNVFLIPKDSSFILVRADLEARDFLKTSYQHHYPSDIRALIFHNCSITTHT